MGVSCFFDNKLLWTFISWCYTATVHLTVLVVFQKQILKIINFEPFSSLSLELFSKNNILIILNLYKFKTLLTAYFLFHSSYIPHNIFVYTTWQSNINLPLLVFSSTSGHRGTTYLEAMPWNNLPVSLRTLTPKLCFKRELRQHIQCWGCCLWPRCWLAIAHKDPVINFAVKRFFNLFLFSFD